MPDLLPTSFRRWLGLPYSRQLSAKEIDNRLRQGNRKKSLPDQLNRGYKFQVKLEVDRLDAAIRAAENSDLPIRRALYAIYREIERDDQVRSQVRTARIQLMRSPVEVRRSGVVDKQLTKLCESAWFGSLVEMWIDTEMWGHSLVELYPLAANANASTARFDVTLIDREHVSPEWGIVSLDQAIMHQGGVAFRQNKEYPFLLEMGGKRDLGIFASVALPVIRKRYSDSDWSLFSERFGMPLLNIKTSAVEDAEITKRENWARNFGSAGYVITDDQDEVQMLTPNMVGTGHYVFRDRMEEANKQISKLINGQTATADEKSFVGSAEVQERVLNDYGFARLRRLRNWINDELLAYFERIGVGWGKDVELVFLELERKDEEQGAETDDKPDGPPPPPTPGKSRALSLSAELSAYYGVADIELQGEALAHRFSREEVDGWLERTRLVHSKGYVDAEAFRTIAGRLIAAAGDSLGTDLTRIDPSTPRGKLYRDMRDSLLGFTAAKLRAAGDEVADIDASGTGNPRAVARNYLNRYTETEERAVVAQAQTTRTYLDAVDENPDQHFRYSTAGDRVVRPEHRALDGIVSPLGSDFWALYWPPNGWNCRCLAEPAPAGTGRTPPEDLEPTDVPPVFRDNPGVSGRFLADNPYVERVPEATVRRAADDASSAMELYDETDVPGLRIHPQRTRLAERDAEQKRILSREVETLTRAVEDLGHLIDMTGINRTGKNPEGFAYLPNIPDKLVAEVKGLTGSANAVRKQIKNAFKQEANVLYLDYGQDRETGEHGAGAIKSARRVLEIVQGHIAQHYADRGVRVYVWYDGTYVGTIND